ncbi:MAG: M56 family metallopeptidase [Eubacteriales bacterium]|nr:M56 family metallopeptidase [Eubacteriales bacterium]
MSGIFLNILELSVSMMPIIGLLLILSPLISKIYSSTLQYWIWLVITIRLLIPFSTVKGFPFIFEIPFLERLTLDNPAIGVTASINNSPVYGAAFLKTMPMLNVLEIITALYFAGLIIFILYKLTCYMIFIISIRKYYCIPSHKTVDAALEIGQEVGLKMKKDAPGIYICRKISGPVVFGVLKPVLLLPDEKNDDLKLRMILRHEMIHMKRNDTLFKILLMIISAIHWFNPFVHIMSRRASRDIEISCDTKTLSGADHEEKKLYSLMILDMASPRASRRFSSFLTSFGTGKESLEVRIKNIFSSTKRKKGYVPLILVIFIAIFFGAAMQINYPAAYAEEAGKVVSESAEAMQETETINADNNEEDLQTRVSENEHNENQSGSSQSAVSDKAADINSDELSPHAEIVVIDLERLDLGEELNE